MLPKVKVIIGALVVEVKLNRFAMGHTKEQISRLLNTQRTKPKLFIFAAAKRLRTNRYVTAAIKTSIITYSIVILSKAEGSYQSIGFTPDIRSFGFAQDDKLTTLKSCTKNA